MMLERGHAPYRSHIVILDSMRHSVGVIRVGACLPRLLSLSIRFSCVAPPWGVTCQYTQPSYLSQGFPALICLGPGHQTPLVLITISATRSYRNRHDDLHILLQWLRPVFSLLCERDGPYVQRLSWG